MDNVLVFKTAVDFVTDGLFDFLGSKDIKIYCCIQSSSISRYSAMYPNVHFIDIKRDGFYDIPEDVIAYLQKIAFEKIYIPTTNVKAYNFGNVIELVDRLDYKIIEFYNCKGESCIIYKMSKIKEYCIKIYIKILKILCLKSR